MKGTVQFALLSLLLGWPPLAYAEATQRLATLRAGFEAALAPLDDGYRRLNQTYRLALTRLVEAESKAGKLDAALAAKAEMDAFESKKVFDETEFRNRISADSALRRLQNTYLEQRSALDRQTGQQRKELVQRFDQELEKLRNELTTAGRLEDAVAVSKAQEQFQRDPQFIRYFSSSSAIPSIRGRIHFVTKGELELYLNGAELSYRNDYKGPDSTMRITGETKGSEDFRAGDILLVRARSSATFRGVILSIVSEDKSAEVPIRVEQLRFLGVDKDVASFTAEAIESSARGGVDQGGSDVYMNQSWSELNLTPSEQGGSQWFRGETADVWNTWAVVLTPEMIGALGTK